jgi:hypothetical protein
MNPSKIEDEDADYWNRTARSQWDRNCRISHGQLSWYFSLLGRKEKMALFQKKGSKDKHWSADH